MFGIVWSAICQHSATIWVNTIKHIWSQQVASLSVYILFVKVCWPIEIDLYTAYGCSTCFGPQKLGHQTPGDESHELGSCDTVFSSNRSHEILEICWKLGTEKFFFLQVPSNSPLPSPRPLRPSLCGMRSVIMRACCCFCVSGTNMNQYAYT